MPGSKQHFLPATYLACFSVGSAFPRRSRRLAQGDRLNGTCIETSAANLAKITDLYTLEQHTANPNVIDDIWLKYETRLSDCIDQMIAGSITALDWASVLVPFVACLLVRGPEFEERFNSRLQGMGFDSEFLESLSDNAKQARIMEIQRLLAPVLVAEWTLLEFAQGEPLLTNDWSYLVVDWGKGLTIPVGHNHAIQVAPRTEGIIAAKVGDTWRPAIRKIDINASNRTTFNRAMAENARRFIFGVDCNLVTKYLSRPSFSPPMIEPAHIGFIYGTRALVHEFVWHRFVSALHSGIEPEMGGWDFDFNFEGLATGWVPPLMCPTNLPDFRPGLLRWKDVIIADLYDAPDPMPTIR